MEGGSRLDACDEDIRLMQAFAAGDESAFDQLFERWSGRLLHFLERMVREPAVAEELVQETFLRVHRARSRYRPEARFSTWLYTIASNAARNELRRPFRREVHESADQSDTGEGVPIRLVSSNPAPDDVAHARQVSGEVDLALHGLPPRQREALWLCAVEGFSYSEIARTLSTSEKSVKALVHRARVGLNAALAERRDPEEVAR